MKTIFLMGYKIYFSIVALKILSSPGWCGSVDWVPAYEPKCHRFDRQPGHMLGLQARSPVGGVQESTTLWCFSPSLSPPLPFSLLKKKKNHLYTWLWSSCAGTKKYLPITVFREFQVKFACGLAQNPREWEPEHNCGEHKKLLFFKRISETTVEDPVEVVRGEGREGVKRGKSCQ